MTPPHPIQKRIEGPYYTDQNPAPPCDRPGRIFEIRGRKRIQWRLFADAKSRKNGSQKIVRCDFAGEFGQVPQDGAHFFGEELGA